jgi:hypothetical protein
VGNGLTLRRAAGFVAATAVMATTAVAARHDPDAAATTVEAAVETAWLPGPGGRLLLADARQTRALAAVTFPENPAIVTQDGDSAIAVGGHSISLVDGSWTRRSVSLPLAGGPPPSPPDSRPDTPSVVAVGGPESAWLLSPGQGWARPVQPDAGPDWLGPPVDTGTGTSAVDARVTADGTLWILAGDHLRGVHPGRPARVVSLEPTTDARALTLVDDDPVVIDAHGARRLDPDRLAFDRAWPLTLPPGPIVAAERSGTVAVARTADRLAVAGPATPAVTITVDADPGGGAPVERDGLVYVTDRSTHEIVVHDPRAGGRPARRIPVAGRSALSVTLHHHRVWYTQGAADDDPGVITDALTARSITPAATAPDDPDAGDTAASRGGEHPGVAPPAPTTPSLALAADDCPANWPIDRCPADPGRPRPASSAPTDPTSLACPRTWPTGACTVTGIDPAERNGSDHPTGPGGGGPGNGGGAGGSPPTSAPSDQPGPAGRRGLPAVLNTDRARGTTELERAGLHIRNVHEVPDLAAAGTIVAVYHDGVLLEPGAPIGPDWQVDLDVSDGTRPVIAIGNSAWRTCVVTFDHLVACWGRNGSGELGNGTLDYSATPVYVRGITDAINVSVSPEGRVCALHADHTISCWGHGPVGDGTREDRSTPVPITTLHDIVQVDAAQVSTCALDRDGTVWCWGHDFFTERPTGAQIDPTVLVTAPTPVPDITGATAISIGDDVGCAVVRDGNVRCWGTNRDGQLGPPLDPRFEPAVTIIDPGSGLPLTGATAIEVDRYQSCARVATGITCWGHFRELPLGPAEFVFLLPNPVPGAGATTQFSMDGNFGCAVMLDGTLRCWGVMPYDSGITFVRNWIQEPTAVQGIGDATAVAVSGQVCVIRKDRTLWCWGEVPGKDAAGDAIARQSIRIPIPPPT